MTDNHSLDALKEYIIARLNQLECMQKDTNCTEYHLYSKLRTTLINKVKFIKRIHVKHITHASQEGPGGGVVHEYFTVPIAYERNQNGGVCFKGQMYSLTVTDISNEDMLNIMENKPDILTKQIQIKIYDSTKFSNYRTEWRGRDNFYIEGNALIIRLKGVSL